MSNDQDHVRDINAFHLDKKVVWIWASNMILSSIVVLILIAGILLITNYSVFGFSVSESILYLLLLIFILNSIYIWWLRIEYDNYIYYFTTSGVVIKHGVITTDRHVIPYERIQDIGVSRSVIERFLQLATIRIETAAFGSHTLKYRIPSVSNYKSIVNHILERKNKALKVKESEKDKKIELMESLLEEVKGLKSLLSTNSNTSKPKKGRSDET